MIWILDCEELITLTCWPKPLVRLNCLLVHYPPSKSIFDDDFDDFGLFACQANPSPPTTMVPPAFCKLPLICLELLFACFWYPWYGQYSVARQTRFAFVIKVNVIGWSWHNIEYIFRLSLSFSCQTYSVKIHMFDRSAVVRPVSLEPQSCWEVEWVNESRPRTSPGIN